MQRESRVPPDADVVVRPEPRLGFRQRGFSLALFVFLILFSVAGGVVSGSLFWFGFAAVCVVGVGIEMLVLRSQVWLGPSLAADREHVWVRFGGVLRPDVVRLAWSEISDVSVVSWHGRRGALAHCLTFTLTDDARAELPEHPVLARHAKGLQKVFGAEFAISDNLKSVWLGEPFRAMEVLAPAAVKFTD
jgi:hypothetical protein